MHEMHIVDNLIEDLQRLANENKTERITKIYLKMGEFTELNEEVVSFALKEKGKNTAIDGAEVSFEKSPKRELRLVSFDCE